MAAKESGLTRAAWCRASGLEADLDDPDIAIDNSLTEREFQNVAKLRLNMLFAGSTEGAHRACVLLGIAGTFARPPAGP